MNKISETILQLIQQSQFTTCGISYELSKEEWDEVYKEASSQSVLGLVSNEVPKEVLDSESRWEQARYQQIASYVRYCQAETELKRVLDEGEIPFAILKGNAAAVYYLHPDRRMMGDIDFIVPQQMFELAMEVLLTHGYKAERAFGPSERHVEFRKSGVEFELHHHFSYEDLDIEEYLDDGIDKRIMAHIAHHEFPMLPPLANGLVLLAHARYHLMNGMGLRQIVDWMMYVDKQLSDDFWQEEFEKAAVSKGLDQFAKVMTRMCQKYLGLSDSITWCMDVDESLCDEFIEVVLDSGNFGRKNGEGGKVETVSANMRRKGLFRWLQYAGEFNWKAYKKHPWLKPFCWIYQIFRYLSQGLKTKRSAKQLSGDFSRSKRRTELLAKLGI